MRTLIGLAAMCGIGVTLLFAQSKFTPMQLQTGWWESTNTITTAGMSQDGGSQHTRTYTNKGCLTRQDIARDPFAKLGKGEGEEGMNCKENLIRSTGSDADVEVSCSSQQMTATYRLKIHADDPEHVTGSGQGSMNLFGNTMKSQMSLRSHWLQSTCPSK